MLRRRIPLVSGVLICVLAVVSLFTGATHSMPGVAFELPGHWVYDALAKAAFHIDGSTGNVDSQAPLPADPGSQVVQGGSSGYVVGNSRISQFGQSSLSVEQTTTPPSSEIPVGIEATGGPYLVYRNAGKVVRLGDSVATISTGSPVGVPVVTGEGTMWLFLPKTGRVCELPENATSVGSCPGVVPGGHAGALTMVGDSPEFVDTTANDISPVSTSGLGSSVPLGVDLAANSAPAAQDVAGRVAILDQPKHQIYLVDPHQSAAPPVTITLPQTGSYDGPVSSGAAVAVIDSTDNTLLTYGKDGKQQAAMPIPRQAGPPRLTRGEDGRVYVDDYEGNDVFVVGSTGSVVNVPVAPLPTTPSPNSSTTPTAPAVPTAPNTNPLPPPRQLAPVQRVAPPKAPVQPQRQPVQPTQPPAQPATPPGAPSNVSATAGAGSATVSWAAAEDNRSAITQYRISWSGGSTTVSGTGRQASISGLTDGAQYTFSVAAQNAIGIGPAVSANPVTPVDVADAPGNPRVQPNKQLVEFSWDAPNLHGGALEHYLAGSTGQADQTVTGTQASFSIAGAAPGSSITFTVRAVTTAAGGRVLTGAAASVSMTVPKPSIKVSRGADSESSDCKAPDCAWVHVVMTGFAPDTKYSVVPYTGDAGGGSGHVFSDPCTATTDANGDATCDDIRFDVGGQLVWVDVQTDNGQVESNHYYWTPQ